MTDINEQQDPSTHTELCDSDCGHDVAEVIDDEVKAVRKSRAKVVEPGPAVVSGGLSDDVFLERCVFMNVFNRKSLTVHHLQRRLNELGYTEALTDKDGWYGEVTRDAVAAWQRDNNIEGDGTMTAGTFTAIFEGDVNVNVRV